MRITPTKIKDVLVIEPDIFIDDRGWFTELYNKEKLKTFGIDADFVQDNYSLTKKSGTLRGLHFQQNPYAQSKLVSCTKGAVLDVAVDLRKNSPTYKQWVALELTEENKKQIFIPKGFAHGFLTLADNTKLQYKIDNHYNKGSERTIRYDDPEIGIDWGNTDPILLERDRNAPLFKNSDINF